mgnify:CR=1 FL=1
MVEGMLFHRFELRPCQTCRIRVHSGDLVKFGSVCAVD